MKLRKATLFIADYIGKRPIIGRCARERPSSASCWPTTRARRPREHLRKGETPVVTILPRKRSTEIERSSHQGRHGEASRAYVDITEIGRAASLHAEEHDDRT